jgi:hypothetical protein
LIESPAFSARHRFTEQQFTRERILSAPTLILFLLNLVQGALQGELDRFFEIVRGATLMSRVVSKAAFWLARRKLHFGAFVEINRVLVEAFYAEQPVRRWRGWRLLAIDGSTAQVPCTAEVLAWFGVVDPAATTPCAIGRVSTLYDVLNRVIVEAHLAPYRIGEHELAVEHLSRVRPDDLVLFDRGYPAFWLLALLSTRGLHYCMRATLTYCPAVEQFIRSGQTEALITLCPGAEARRECRRKGLAVDPLSVRVVRVELPTGEVEVLLTSLHNTVAYPHAVFAELYHQRWGIEEGYKAIKCRAEVENFTGKSVLAVMQDFHAKVVTTNLTALLAHQAQESLPTTPRRHSVRVNFSHALARMKDTIVRLFTVPDPRPLLHALLDLLRRTVEPVRHLRSFPRTFRITLRRFHPTYKRCG